MTPQKLLENNQAWATEMVAADPEFFSRLSHQQRPSYLWIGCSDSRVPANQIIGLPPGEVFVHRNIGNLAHPTDINLMSVLEYGVDVLSVRHVIVCGHYGCGGVQAALGGRLPGIADFWLEPVRALCRTHAEDLKGLSGKELADRMCEYNVAAQLENLVHCGIVQCAWERGQRLSIHGWIYGLRDGRIRDLGITRTG